MNTQTISQKILYFFLTKIIIGIAVIVGLIVFIEWLGKLILDKTQLTDEIKNAVISITQIICALVVYVSLFRVYEKRKIDELKLSAFPKNAFFGFLTGLILQSLMILVIYLSGGYSILQVNPFSFLFPGFISSLTAGFIAEILILGVFFRLMEENLGTIITLMISGFLFGVMHSGVKGATILSVLSTVMQAGILLPAAYVFARNLWFPIFLHFAWDFAEPSIYGGINPSLTSEKTLFVSKITGAEFLTGGKFGPQSSLQSIIFCLALGLIFLWLAKQKNNFIKPF